MCIFNLFIVLWCCSFTSASLYNLTHQDNPISTAKCLHPVYEGLISFGYHPRAVSEHWRMMLTAYFKYLRPVTCIQNPSVCFGLCDDATCTWRGTADVLLRHFQVKCSGNKIYGLLQSSPNGVWRLLHCYIWWQNQWKGTWLKYLDGWIDDKICTDL